MMVALLTIYLIICCLQTNSGLQICTLSPPSNFHIKWPIPFHKRTEHFYNFIAETLEPYGGDIQMGGLIQDPVEFQAFCDRLPASIRIIKDLIKYRLSDTILSRAGISIVMETLHAWYLENHCKNASTVQNWVTEAKRINAYTNVLSAKRNWNIRVLNAIPYMVRHHRLENGLKFGCCSYEHHKRNLTYALPQDLQVRDMIVYRLNNVSLPGMEAACHGGENYSQFRFDCDTVDWNIIRMPEDQSLRWMSSSIYLGYINLMSVFK